MRYLILGLLFVFSFSLQADTQPSSSKPFSSQPQLKSPPPPPKKEAPHREYKPTHIPKTELPPMTKPFGMPGVVGFQNGKWEGTDYLGYLSHNIGINVEIFKADNVPQVSDAGAIESLLGSIFTKENINPNVEVSEGPPLPFLHILLFIYPIDKDRYVVFGSSRLFEQIQVVRKDFVPTGFWQGITWENQEVVIANGQQLNAQLRTVAEKLATAFAQRFTQYNLNREGLPKR